MSIDPIYLNKFIKVTERAAYGAYKHVGKGDKQLADKGAVDEMRKELNKIEMAGEVVIGEGEMDHAPMLYIGEKIGTNTGQNLDIALDPLEGTNFVANNLPNSFSMIAVAEKKNIFSAPDTYMEKIAIGSNLPNNLLDLDNTVETNIELLSKAQNKKKSEITACVLKRPRHDKIINDLKRIGVKIEFISDGDVYGAMAVCDEKSPIDIYMGVGGAPEGVLAAAALSCLGGQIQTRLVLKNEKENERAKKMGINNPQKKFNIDELIKGDVIFCATAITDGKILNGIKLEKDYFLASTYALHKDKKIKKKITNSLKK
ncbi:MAG: fructose-bisphosphatase class II [Pelagibacteraceae bacterium TMED216]|nr:MAG: fructose-bisphosphatase class II [Pelagibacteraceae bacterium TMED216]|tara:strand:+ start:801 stop:1745 length:945 start_codon:yes stop_codon:yes gene_type:complete